MNPTNHDIYLWLHKIIFVKQASKWWCRMVFSHEENSKIVKFKSSPNDRMLDLSKFEVFADDKLKVAKITELLGKIENIVGKGENAGYQHFLLYSQCFQKPSSLRSLKVGIVW